MHYKLSKEIIELSNSTLWDKAKLEWRFEYAYYNEDLSTCLCGHYPIKNICVLKNIENGNLAEVGNKCVNKFLNINKGDKVFDSISRLKGDLSKAMSQEALEYLNSKEQLTDFEYNFYCDTIRKRKLSEKQTAIRKRINQKFLDFTHYKSNSDLSKINLVLKWAEDNPRFDTQFILSLKGSYEKYEKLSNKQITALNNIISKYKIK